MMSRKQKLLVFMFFIIYFLMWLGSRLHEQNKADLWKVGRNWEAKVENFCKKKGNSETRLLFLLVLEAPMASRLKSRLQLTCCRHACPRSSAYERVGSQQLAVLFVVDLAAKQIEDRCQAAMGRCPKSWYAVGSAPFLSGTMQSTMPLPALQETPKPPWLEALGRLRAWIAVTGTSDPGQLVVCAAKRIE